jgi:hypothetical protein
MSLKKITYQTWSEIPLSGREPPSAKTVEGNCNLFIELKDGRPLIHVIATEQHDGDSILKNGPFIFDNILKQFFPEHSLHDVAWTYTNGPYHSDVVFDGTGNITTGMTVTNHFATQNHTSYYQKDYQAEYQSAIDSGEDFSAALKRIHGSAQGYPLKRIIVPIPLHPQKFLCLKSDYGDVPHMKDDFEVVFADTSKLIDLWTRQSEPKIGGRQDLTGHLKSLFGQKSQNPRSQEDLDLIATTVAKSILHVRPELGYPNVPAFASFSSENSEIGFNNGRHRTANLARLGAPFIPIEMYKGPDTNSFKSLFEWRGENFVHPVLEKNSYEL